MCYLTSSHLKPLHRITMIIGCIVLIGVFACGKAQHASEQQPSTEQLQISIIDTSGKNINTRIHPPTGYVRLSVDSNSFGYYLRHLPLKPHKASVHYYDGSIKMNPNIYIAVVDQPIGNKDLHQCADAVMHLRADYLWQTGQYDRIHFDLTNGFRMEYAQWMAGNRLVVSGNQTSWKKTAEASNTASDLWAYLEKVFTFAGTLSLSRELVSVPRDNMQPGDVFIKGGSPGHAEIVVDMATDTLTGKKVFLLAQSFMPAQETQILCNNEEPEISPWYSLDFGTSLHTPEYWFNDTQLMRFQD